MIPLTVLILTYNEEANVGRTLGALSWVKEIVIVDSGSTDRTVEIAKGTHPNVQVVERQFDSHTNQWNFGLDQVTTEWVLALDADYEVSPQLAAEICALNPKPEEIGFWAEFEYRIYGRPLRGSSYPPRIVLFKPSRARYVDDGHTQTLWIWDAKGELKPPFEQGASAFAQGYGATRGSGEQGVNQKSQVTGQESAEKGGQETKIGRLFGKIYHDDRKPLSRWIQEQDRYSKLEARHLIRSRKSHVTGQGQRKALDYGTTRQPHNTEQAASAYARGSGATRPDYAGEKGKVELSVQDRLRLKIFFAAPVMFLYLLFVRGLILDGWPGWFYVAQRTIAEFLLSLRLLTEREKLEFGDRRS